MNSIQGNILALDLSMIRAALMRRHGWSEEKTKVTEAAYKDFLMQASQSTSVPDSAVDAFWHEHILHTEKYANDCQSAFGCFLHHYPSSSDDTCGSGGGCKSKCKSKAQN